MAGQHRITAARRRVMGSHVTPTFVAKTGYAGRSYALDVILLAAV